MEWNNAPDIKKNLEKIVRSLELSYLKTSRITCFRSEGSTSRARARIWGFPRVWQQALNLPPHYIIEVISRHFDHLSGDDQDRILIHELLHIPKNFSGALVPHKRRKWKLGNAAEELFKKFKKCI